MSADNKGGVGSRYPSFLSKAERLQRCRERPVPRAEPHLTIGGADETETKRRLDQLREGRIGVLNTGLREAEIKTETDFAFASVKGRARVDFERER